MESYGKLRRELDEAGYRDSMPLEGLPLTQHLFRDLSKTTHSLHKTLQQLNYYTQIAQELEAGVTPFKEENVRLIKENSHLRMASVRLQEEAEERVKSSSTRLKDLEAENGDLKLLVNRFAQRLKQLEIDSLTKTQKIAKLQERDLEGHIIIPEGKNKHLQKESKSRQTMEIDCFVPDPCPYCVRVRNLALYDEENDPAAVDYLQIADSRIEALQLQIRCLKSSEKDLTNSLQSMKSKVDSRDKEIDKLRHYVQVRPGSDNLANSQSKSSKGDSTCQIFNKDLEMELRSAQLQLDLVQRRNINLEKKLKSSILQEHEDFMLGRKRSAKELEMLRDLTEFDIDKYPTHDEMTLNEKLQYLEQQLSNCCKEKAALKAKLEKCENNKKDDKDGKGSKVQDFEDTSGSGFNPDSTQHSENEREVGRIGSKGSTKGSWEFDSHPVNARSFSVVGRGNVVDIHEIHESGSGRFGVKHKNLKSIKSIIKKPSVTKPKIKSKLSYSNVKSTDSSKLSENTPGSKEKTGLNIASTNKDANSLFHVTKVSSGPKERTKETAEDYDLTLENIREIQKQQNSTPPRTQAQIEKERFKSKSKISNTNVSKPISSTNIKVPPKDLKRKVSISKVKLSNVSKHSSTSGGGVGVSGSGGFSSSSSKSKSGERSREFKRVDSVDSSDKIHTKRFIATPSVAGTSVQGSVARSSRGSQEESRVESSDKIHNKGFLTTPASGGDDSQAESVTEDSNSRSKSPEPRPPSPTAPGAGSNTGGSKSDQGFDGFDSDREVHYFEYDLDQNPFTVEKTQKSKKEKVTISGARVRRTEEPNSVKNADNLVTNIKNLSTLSQGRPQMRVEERNRRHKSPAISNQLNGIQELSYPLPKNTKKTKNIQEKPRIREEFEGDMDNRAIRPLRTEQQGQVQGQESDPDFEEETELIENPKENTSGSDLPTKSSLKKSKGLSDIPKSQDVQKSVRVESPVRFGSRPTKKEEQLLQELQYKTHDCESHLAELAQLKSALQSAELDLEVGKDQDLHVSRLKRQINTLEQDLQTVTKERDELRSESERLSRSLAHLAQFQTQQQQQSSRSMNKWSQQPTARVFDEFDPNSRRREEELEREVLRLQSTLKSVDRSKADLLSELENKDQRLKRLVTESEKNIAELSRVQVLLRTQEYQQSKSMTSLPFHQTNGSGSRSRETSRDLEIETTQREIQFLKRQNESLRRDLESSRKERDDLSNLRHATPRDTNISNPEEIYTRLTPSSSQLSQHQPRDHELNRILRQQASREQELTEEISRLRSSLNKLDRDKDDLRSELDRKDEKLARLSKEHEVKLNDLSKTQLLLKNAEYKIQDYTSSDLREHEREVQGLKRQIEGLKRDLDTVGKERDESLKDCRRLASAVSKEEVERRSLATEFDKRNKENDELRKQVQKYIEEVRRIEDLLLQKEEEMELLIEHYRNLSLEKSTLETQRSSLEIEASSIRSDVRETVDQNLTLKNQLSSQNALVSSYEEEIERLSIQLTALESELQKVASKEKSSTDDMKAARDLMFTLDTKMDKMKLDLAEAEGTRRKLEVENEEMKEHIGLLEEQLKHEVEKGTKLQDLVEEKREKEFRGERKEQEEMREREGMAERLKSLQMRTETLNEDVSKWRLKSIELQSELDRTRRQLVAEKGERETAIAELRRVQEQLNNSSTNSLLNAALSGVSPSVSELSGGSGRGGGAIASVQAAGAVGTPGRSLPFSPMSETYLDSSQSRQSAQPLGGSGGGSTGRDRDVGSEGRDDSDTTTTP